MGCRAQGTGEGVIVYALSIGATPRVRAVPGAEIWDLEKESTLESSFDTSACSKGKTKKKKVNDSPS